MGLIQNIRNRREERRLSRMEKDLIKLHDRLAFNPYKAINVSSKQDEEERFTRRIQEFKILSTGNANQIRKFYSSKDDDHLNFFWNKATDKYIKVHAGFPKLVADKMVQLGVGNGVNITLEVFNEDGELDEEKSKVATDTWKAIEEKTNFIECISQMFFNDAVTGHDIVKFNYDLSISQYPVIEVKDLTECELEKVRGITKGIVFHQYFVKKEDKFRFDETYTVNNEGEAIIINELYKRLPNGKEEQVPLSSIPETSYLEEGRKQSEENPLTFIQELTGLEGMIAFEKANKLPNNEFFNSNYGRSDIAATDLSDKLDEIASEIAGEVRNNKAISFIPTTLLEHDEYGNAIEWNPFVTRFQQIEGSMDQNANNQIKTEFIQDKTEAHISKAKIYMDMYCASCGLSPLTLGITSFEAVGANVSGDGFRERIKTTIDTRNAKIAKFKPYLSNIVRQLLAFDYWLVTTVGAKQPGLDVVDINFDNTNVIVDFGEYVGQTEAEIFAKVSQAKASGLMSIETCIDELHPDWSDEMKQEEVARIKIENNLSMDTPELLQIGDLINGENS